MTQDHTKKMQEYAREKFNEDTPIMNKIINGDALKILKTLPEKQVHTCVTSPPYFGLRDYGVDAQLGMEDTPEDYVKKMVDVFREIRRVLRDDGTVWLNLGDTYSAGGRGGGGGKQNTNKGSLGLGAWKVQGFAPKQLLGVPWRVAFALQADGWYLRQDIIWSKPNPMPESVTDRCTKAHEYIFLLSKSQKYYFDNEAIKEPLAQTSIQRLGQDIGNQRGSDRVPGKRNAPMKAVRFGGNKAAGYGVRTKSGKEWNPKQGGSGNGFKGHSGNLLADGTTYLNRNRRSVWTVTTKPYKGAHFATFPSDLIKPCILAGAPEGGLVLDPFMGSGTTASVAKQHGRNYIGIELNPEYIKLAEIRLASVLPPQRTLIAV